MRTRAQIVERAQLHVGHRETRPNDSPLIRAWLRRCGILTPAAWCAAFASWCIEGRMHSDGLPAQVAYAGALNLGRLFPLTDRPEPGDLMFFATDDKGHGHCGLVERVESDSVQCIEGNSANSVRRVWRLRSEVWFASTRDEDWQGEQPALRMSPLIHVSYEGTR